MRRFIIKTNRGKLSNNAQSNTCGDIFEIMFTSSTPTHGTVPSIYYSYSPNKIF